MTTTVACSCEVGVSAVDDDAFPAAFLAHVRDVHPDWPFPDLTETGLQRHPGRASLLPDDLEPVGVGVRTGDAAARRSAQGVGGETR